MADTIITNSPERDGGGGAGWVVALFIIIAIVVVGVILYRNGTFGAATPTGDMTMMMGEEKKVSDDKKFSKQIIDKTVISKAGKRFGEVADISKYCPECGKTEYIEDNSPYP